MLRHFFAREEWKKKAESDFRKQLGTHDRTRRNPHIVMESVLAPGDGIALLEPETARRLKAFRAMRRQVGDSAFEAWLDARQPVSAGNVEEAQSLPFVRQQGKKFVVQISVGATAKFTGRSCNSIPEAYRSFVERHPQHVAELEARLAQRGFDLGKLMEGD